LLWEKGTDWVDALLQNGVMQNYTFSYSRGNDKTSNYVSGGVFDQKGIVINTNYCRYTLQFNNQTQVLPWLKFGNNLTLSHDIKKSGSYDVLNTMKALPTQPIMEEDGSYSGPGDQAIWYGDIRNPIGTAKLEKNETKGYNLLGNVYAEATLWNKVVLKTLAGIDYKDWNSTSFSPKYNWKPIPVPASSRSESWNRSLTLLWDNTATYTDTFNEKHSLTAMLGSSAQSNTYRYMNGSIKSFLSDSYNQLNNGLDDPLVGGSTSDWALLSFFGRANYTYDNKYLLTATVRRDGTSRLSKENRWGTFPSFSAAWRFTEEAFYRHNNIFSDRKLRFGYGETGNQAPLDTYAYVTRLKTSQYVFNGTAVSTLYPLVMPSPNVKWETVKQWNAGLDISLFKQRINVVFDAYIKNTSNMLVSMSVPITTGYSDIYTPQINAGKVQNKGWELSISSRNLTGNIRWITDANVSYNRNKIVRLDGDVPIYFGYQTHTVGKPIGAFYGYVTNGIFQNQNEVNNYALQIAGGTSPGDIKFKDLDNNGVINEQDRTYLGNPTPSWIFSMNNNLSYKNFDLEIFFQGVAGNDIYNANRVSLEGMSTVVNQTTKVLDRWTGEGTSNSIPRAVYADPNNNNRNSNRFIEDGSYLRLKNIKLGYTIPERLAKKITLSSARIYFSGQNLLTLTKYSGFDPEVSGVDSGNYPLTRTFSMGIDIKF
jgi:TonB-linked SusC/RagA family outer membrane protein